MNIKLSLIIPVYNAEKSISKCLDSILCQNLDGVQIVIVDDGSTDSSNIICNEYMKKCKNIELYTIENSGPSNARNVGIDKSGGEYITFIDSDDWVSPDYIDTSLKCIDDGIDFAIFGITEVKSENISKDFKINLNYDRCIDFISYNYLWAPWGKLIKSEIVKNKFNINYRIAEDVHFWVDNLLNKDINYKYISNTRYFYNATNESITRTNIVSNNQLSALDSIISIVNKTDDGLKEFFMIYYVHLCSKYIYLCKKDNSLDKNYIKYYNEYYNFLIKSNINLKNKIKIFILKKFKTIYFKCKG